MGKNLKLKGDVTKSFLKKYTNEKGELTVSKKELAKLILHSHPELFADLEAARQRVRYYTGASGKGLRQYIKKEDIKLSTIAEGLKKSGIYSMHEKLPDPIELPIGKYGVIQDVHIPFQHDEALATAVTHLLNAGIDGLIFNGDILDCYDASKFAKEMNRPRLKEEMHMGYAFLKKMRDYFPGIPMWYKLGNHVERMRHYILRNAKELSDFQELSLEHMLHFDELKITKVGREIIRAGKFNILHGHEFGMTTYSPVNVAKGLFNRITASGGVGHHHQRSVHRVNNLDGHMFNIHSFGCLCHMDPEYRPYGTLNWQHGFAMVSVLNEDGDFLVENLEIVKGEIYK